MSQESASNNQVVRRKQLNMVEVVNRSLFWGWKKERYKATVLCSQTMARVPGRRVGAGLQRGGFSLGGCPQGQVSPRGSRDSTIPGVSPFAIPVLPRLSVLLTAPSRGWQTTG